MIECRVFANSIRLVGRMVPHVLNLGSQRYTNDQTRPISSSNGEADTAVTFANANTTQLWWSMNYNQREDLIEVITHLLLAVLPQRFLEMIDNSAGSLEPTAVVNRFGGKQPPRK